MIPENVAGRVVLAVLSCFVFQSFQMWWFKMKLPHILAHGGWLRLRCQLIRGISLLLPFLLLVDRISLYRKKTAIWKKRALNPISNKWFTSCIFFFLSNRKCNTKTVLIMTNNKQSVHCIWAPGWKASSFLDPRVYGVCSGHILSLWDREQTQETVSNSGTQTANMIHAGRKNKNIQKLCTPSKGTIMGKIWTTCCNKQLRATKSSRLTVSVFVALAVGSRPLLRTDRITRLPDCGLLCRESLWKGGRRVARGQGSWGPQRNPVVRGG